MMMSVEKVGIILLDIERSRGESLVHSQRQSKKAFEFMLFNIGKNFVHADFFSYYIHASTKTVFSVAV